MSLTDPTRYSDHEDGVLADKCGYLCVDPRKPVGVDQNEAVDFGTDIAHAFHIIARHILCIAIHVPSLLGLSVP